jgi:hypothetical protein
MALYQTWFENLIRLRVLFLLPLREKVRMRGIILSPSPLSLPSRDVEGEEEGNVFTVLSVSVVAKRLVVVTLKGLRNELFFELSDLVGFEKRLSGAGHNSPPALSRPLVPLF